MLGNISLIIYLFIYFPHRLCLLNLFSLWQSQSDNSVFIQSEDFFELVIELIEYDGSLFGGKAAKKKKQKPNKKNPQWYRIENLLTNTWYFKLKEGLLAHREFPVWLTKLF